MRRSLGLTVVGVFLLSTTASGQTPWERYLQLPSSENAKRVRVATYSDTAINETNLDRLEEDFGLLEIQMDAGDREAVRLAFRLLPHAGADDGEALDVMLGRLIRINPMLFLEVAREAHPAECRVGGNYGKEYVDREAAQQYESRRRIAALQSVHRDDLKKIRDRCLASIKGSGHR